MQAEHWCVDWRQQQNEVCHARWTTTSLLVPLWCPQYSATCLSLVSHLRLKESGVWGLGFLGKGADSAETL